MQTLFCNTRLPSLFHLPSLHHLLSSNPLGVMGKPFLSGCADGSNSDRGTRTAVYQARAREWPYRVKQEHAPCLPVTGLRIQLEGGRWLSARDYPALHSRRPLLILQFPNSDLRPPRYCVDGCKANVPRRVSLFNPLGVYVYKIQRFICKREFFFKIHAHNVPTSETALRETGRDVRANEKKKSTHRSKVGLAHGERGLQKQTLTHTPNKEVLTQAKYLAPIEKAS